MIATVTGQSYKCNNENRKGLGAVQGHDIIFSRTTFEQLFRIELFRTGKLILSEQKNRFPSHSRPVGIIAFIKAALRQKLKACRADKSAPASTVNTIDIVHTVYIVSLIAFSSSWHDFPKIQRVARTCLPWVRRRVTDSCVNLPTINVTRAPKWFFPVLRIAFRSPR